MILLMLGRLLRLTFGVWLCAAVLFASDIDGIWAGQQQGRAGMEDVAFRFKLDGQSLKGTLFGDEFDLPISEGSFDGGQIRFVITNVNYYNGTKTVFLYTGSLKAGEMELVKQRAPSAEDIAAKRPIVKQTLTLKRIN